MDRYCGGKKDGRADTGSSAVCSHDQVLESCQEYSAAKRVTNEYYVFVRRQVCQMVTQRMARQPRNLNSG
jgi:hypothetical protein